MNIYKAEASVEGLPEKILAGKSFAYTVPVNPWTESERANHYALFQRLKDKTKASTQDEDLYPTKSILVSSNWNKNDDIFFPVELWPARHTPSHKRTNLEHDETKIVGHITETWALDKDGNLIPEDTLSDDLPELYHIANGAVIYRHWDDKNLETRAEELIENIKQGKVYVSMEVLFPNFDYGIMTSEGTYHVIPRAKDTAFLTKHLRAYGGNGVFDNCRVGRVLRSMIFSGKGYVAKPANEYSIMLSDDVKTFNFSSASPENPFKINSGVHYSYSSQNKQEKIMSDTDNLLQKQNEKLEARAAALEVKVEELTKTASVANVQKLEAEVADLKSKLEAANIKVTELATAKDTLAGELTEVKKAKATLEEEVATAKKAKINSDRISYLVDGKVSREVAEKKAKAYENLNDEQFKSIAEDIIAAVPKTEVVTPPKEEEENLVVDPAASKASEEVLSSATPTKQTALAADPSKTDKDTEETRLKLRKALANVLTGYNEGE